MKDLKSYLISEGKHNKPNYVDNITKKGLNKISVGDNLDGGYNDMNVDVVYFSKPSKYRQAIIIKIGDKFMDWFKNGKFGWEPLTYFEDGDDPKEVWKENGFGDCPEWLNTDSFPKDWNEVDKELKEILIN